MNTLPATQPQLSMKRISLFFLPLVLNVQLMSVSHSIINSFMARLDDYVLALASFSVAMVVHLLFASPSYQNHTITLAVVCGPRSFRSMIIFVVIIALFVSLMLNLIAYTWFGDFLLLTVLGVEADVAHSAREAIALMALLPFFTGFRGLFQGLVIRSHRTILVSIATGVRVAALLGFIVWGRRWFDGAQLGAFALVACVAVESVVMGAMAYRNRGTVPGRKDNLATDLEKTPLKVLCFALPVALSSGLQQTIPVVISAIISRLPDATLALAAFGVIRAIMFMLAGPMRNLQQVYLAMVDSAADYEMLVRFFYYTCVVMAVLVLLLAFPLNDLILKQVLGIADDLRLYIVAPMAWCAVFPLFYGATNILRAHFTGSGQTLVLGQATILKFVYLLVCWMFLPLVAPAVSGIGLAIFLLISSECAEGLFLRWQRGRNSATV
ncbi:MAG: hypothetical protein RBR43_04270 [Desulfuromonadaceae bacterium]|nr:hypothetical protein [Desulfuromonas sp.]MDY0185080.1 hypothetical protein [Desulfuromonadaceae bacterium]